MSDPAFSLYGGTFWGIEKQIVLGPDWLQVTAGLSYSRLRFEGIGGSGDSVVGSVRETDISVRFKVDVRLSAIESGLMKGTNLVLAVPATASVLDDIGHMAGARTTQARHTAANRGLEDTAMLAGPPLVIDTLALSGPVGFGIGLLATGLTYQLALNGLIADWYRTHGGRLTVRHVWEGRGWSTVPTWSGPVKPPSSLYFKPLTDPLRSLLKMLTNPSVAPQRTLQWGRGFILLPRSLASRTTQSANGTVTVTRSPSALAFSDSLMRRRISALHKAAARSRTYTPPKTVQHHAPHHPIHGGPLRGGGYYPHNIPYSSGSTSAYSGATKVSSTPKPQTAWSVHQQQAWASG